MKPWQMEQRDIRLGIARGVDNVRYRLARLGLLDEALALGDRASIDAFAAAHRLDKSSLRSALWHMGELKKVGRGPLHGLPRHLADGLGSGNINTD